MRKNSFFLADMSTLYHSLISLKDLFSLIGFKCLILRIGVGGSRTENMKGEMYVYYGSIAIIINA